MVVQGHKDGHDNGTESTKDDGTTATATVTGAGAGAKARALTCLRSSREEQTTETEEKAIASPANSGGRPEPMQDTESVGRRNRKEAGFRAV